MGLRRVSNGAVMEQCTGSSDRAGRMQIGLLLWSGYYREGNVEEEKPTAATASIEQAEAIPAAESDSGEGDE